MKTCTTCNASKPLELFNKKSRSPDGYATRCRECAKIWEKSHYKKKGHMVKSKYKAENSEDELMRQRLWCKHNQHIKNFHTAQYRALKKHATPNWLTEKHWHQIKSIYEEAKRLTKVTGIPHQVDHIYPLNGENGSGLHVPWNLQILTANENNCKNNKVISIYLQS